MANTKGEEEGKLILKKKLYPLQDIEFFNLNNIAFVLIIFI